nr:hypothetical protein [Tanacetum cinerariifolium]
MFVEVEKFMGQLIEVKPAATRAADDLARIESLSSDRVVAVMELEGKLAYQESKAKNQVDSFRWLLTSDEFNVALARILTLGINTSVDKGRRMGRIDTQFQKALQRVSNVVPGPQANFDKAVVAFPSANFPFVLKISQGAKNTLAEVAELQPDKLYSYAPSGITSSSAPATTSLSQNTFGRVSIPKPKKATDVDAPSGV